MNNISVVGRMTKDATVSKVGESWVIRGTIADNFYKPSAEDNTATNFVNFSRFVRKEPTDKFLQRLSKASNVAIIGRLEVSSRVDDKSKTTYQNLSVLVNDMTTFSALENQTTPSTPSTNSTAVPANTNESSDSSTEDEDLPF